ncbi:hypothetical protein BH09PLA1_BH09PLA1_12510 [soil metagenome]
MAEAPTLPFRPVIVAPTYQNARTLTAILQALRTTNLDVIAVNDGCQDDTAMILNAWIDSRDERTDRSRQVITHAQNRGKAAALHSGFGHAREMGFTHAITIDTDGQHDVADVGPLLELSRTNPAALVIGARSTGAGYPLASRMGRAISNFLIRLESGVRVEDSQCGLRVYPLDSALRLKRRAGRFGYETEIITRFAWAGLPILQIPIRCIYDVEGGRTTHFSIGRDSAAAIFMHIWLIARSLFFIPPEKVTEAPPSARRVGFSLHVPGEPEDMQAEVCTPNKRSRTAAHSDAVDTGTIIERFLRWINPVRVWQEIRSDHIGRKRFAASFATGMFIATLPPFGLKTILCLLLARWFRLQPVVVIGSSSLNTPPVGTLLMAMSIVTGHLLLHQRWPTLSRYDPHANGWLNTLRAAGVEWIVGSVVLGAALAAISYVILRLVFRAAPLARANAAAESA